jgi:outer membrane biosynthesis protein TonB
VIVSHGRVIVVLSIALALSLLGVAFLLGRESGRGPQPIVAAAPSEPTVAPPAVAPPAVAPPAVAPPAPTPTPPTPTTPEPAIAPSPTPPPTAHAKDDSAEKQAIARYFREVDQLQNSDVENPEAAASSLINAASDGDTSGLRALVQQARAAEAKAAALTPPAPCEKYHRQLVRVLADSRQMVQALEHGIAGGAVDTLPGLLAQAQATKSRADALAHEERAIKSRFGLAR